jgi:hypothetical protein
MCSDMVMNILMMANLFSRRYRRLNSEVGRRCVCQHLDDTVVNVVPAFFEQLAPRTYLFLFIDTEDIFREIVGCKQGLQPVEMYEHIHTMLTVTSWQRPLATDLAWQPRGAPTHYGSPRRLWSQGSQLGVVQKDPRHPTGGGFEVSGQSYPCACIRKGL